MTQRLKVAVKPSFSAPVSMLLAGDDGKPIEIQFSVTFKRLSGEDNRALQGKLESQSLSDRELLEMVLLDWSDLSDVDDMPFTYSRENLAAASRDWSAFEPAIVRSYFHYAYPAAEKN